MAYPLIEDGDRIFLVGDDGEEFLTEVKAGKKFGTHLGAFQFDEIIGKPYGTSVKTSKGKTLYIVEPGYIDDVFHMNRRTQVVYPKDSSFILMKLDVFEGKRVVDVGAGSAAMSYLFAKAVGKSGKVYTYERREDFYNLAKDNLTKWEVIDRVDLKLKDISSGVEETNVDAFFLDVPHPWEYISVAWKALKGGGRFCTVVPTTNQVQMVLKEIEEFPFVMVEVWESMFRQYKPVPERLRPFDRMVAHTAYMIFAIKVLRGDEDEPG